MKKINNENLEEKKNTFENITTQARDHPFFSFIIPQEYEYQI